MPDRLILQRRLNNSDGWRSVARFRADDSATVQRAADMLASVSEVWWRVVIDDARQQVLSVHNGRAWQAVGEAEPAPAADSGHMPWYQPAASLAAHLRRVRSGEEFADTVPTNPQHRKD